jgi:hypothetical protein
MVMEARRRASSSWRIYPLRVVSRFRRCLRFRGPGQAGDELADPGHLWLGGGLTRHLDGTNAGMIIASPAAPRIPSRSMASKPAP